MSTAYPKPPETVRDFFRRFPDDAACAAYLFQLRWPDGYTCPKCGSKRAYKLAKPPGAVECENHHKVSVTAGTGLHRTKVNLQDWFHAAWLLATLKPGISAVQFQRQTGTNRLETAWAMLHKLRSRLVAPSRDKLTTECSDPRHRWHWIEVDHVEIGGEQSQESRRRKGSNKASVIVAVEVHAWLAEPGDNEPDTIEPGADAAKPRKSKSHRGAKTSVETGAMLRTKAGRCRMRVANSMTQDYSLYWMMENIERNSVLVTDSHKSLAYHARAGMRTREVINAATHADPLPTIGRVTTNLKRWLEGTHKGAVRTQHLQAYLNEFVFRFNRRDIPWIAFNRVLGLAMLGAEPVTYSGLYKHTWVHPNPDPAALARAQGLLP